MKRLYTMHKCIGYQYSFNLLEWLALEISWQFWQFSSKQIQKLTLIFMNAFAFEIVDSIFSLFLIMPESSMSFSKDE